MEKRVFIVHGWNGSPEGGWKPWLKHQLQRRGFKAFVPAMPDPALPKCKEWIRCLEKVVGKPDKNCFFVGHSLGAPAVLRYVESLPASARVGGVVLVAGLAEMHGYIQFKSFFSGPFDWKKLRSICRKFVAIRSDNDLLVPSSDADVFRKNLGAKVLVVGGMGHFSGDEGVTELPAALAAVLAISR